MNSFWTGNIEDIDGYSFQEQWTRMSFFVNLLVEKISASFSEFILGKFAY